MLHINPPKRIESLANRRRRSRSESQKTSTRLPSSLNKLMGPGRLCSDNARSTPDLHLDHFTGKCATTSSNHYVKSPSRNAFPIMMAQEHQLPIAPITQPQLPLRSSSLHSASRTRSPSSSSTSSSPVHHSPSQNRRSSSGLDSEISETSSEESRSQERDQSFPSQAVDDEVRESLLEWTRRSVFIDWTQVLASPRVELFGENSALFGEFQSMASMSKEEQKAEELWNEETPELRKNMIASYLGRTEPFCKDVLRHYVAKFNFTDMQLDMAFRKLCSKLYFKAEAQEIDRVLEAFAHRYWFCNKHGHFQVYGSADIVYAVIYSLMLLNTDLHVARNGHSKMTRSAFCSNTMTTVLDHIDPSQAFILKAGGVQRWKEVMERMLKNMYSAVRQRGVLQPLEERADKPKTLLQRMGSMKQRSTRRESDDESSKSDSRDKDGSYMAGQLQYRKLNDTRQRDMITCFVALERGFLNIRGRERIDLIHTMASLGEKTSTMCLEHGETMWVFECGDQAQTWIRRCNYWAAILSRIPLRHGVNNTEFFGWETCGLRDGHLNVSDWKPPLMPSNASTLNSDTQRSTIENYRAVLQHEYEEHVSLEVRKRLDTSEKARTNWTNKKRHLLSEMRKYNCYNKTIAELHQPTLFDTSQPLLVSTMDLLKEINAQLQLTGINIDDSAL